jgi:PKD repeat protein
MKMKHIIALCLVLALVLPSTALATSSNGQPAKVGIKLIHPRPLTVTAYYSLSGAKEILSHTWNFGDGFTCHCIYRTHTYKKHGTYTISITVKTTKGKILKAHQRVTV